MKKNKKIAAIFARLMLVVMVAVVSFQVDVTGGNFKANTVYAASNLVKGGDFEAGVDTYWNYWTASSTRTYEVYRSYDSPYGYGSYSAEVSVAGTPETRFKAGFITDSNKNYFLVDSTKTYAVVYYAKVSSNSKISVFLENADSFNTISTITEESVTNAWKKYITYFTPTTTGKALLVFAFGDMANNATINFDGVQVFENTMVLGTKELKCSIGESNLAVKVTNVTPFENTDIVVELPYFNPTTGTTGYLKVNPDKIDSTGVYIKCPTGTYSGIANLVVDGKFVNKFDYNVKLAIKDIYPDYVRADEDLTIEGSGFNPIDGRTFIVVKTIGAGGKKFETWIKPHTMDSQLTHATVKLPVGIASDSLYAYASFYNISDKNTESKSASFKYKVKPVIFSTQWSKKGLDQVGDKIKIHGKGVANSPTVIFYDSNNKQVATKAAKVQSIGTTEEVIEVDTPLNSNKLNLTVKVDGVESDMELALAHTAKPKLISIKAKYTRNIISSNVTVPAAKIGEEIVLAGESLNAASSTNLRVEFQGVSGIIKVTPETAQTSVNGKSLKVTVPQGAQNGYMAVVVNEQKSNYLPLEIVPTVISVSPDPVVPGSAVTITANGVGANINLVKVYFNLTTNEKIETKASSVVIENNNGKISLTAPMALSNKFSSVSVQYDKWNSDGQYTLNVRPHIDSASIDKDSGLLVIRGYGFSTVAKENAVTYKYADTAHTVIKPKASILGVYPTEEGQELRIKITDKYHYGYVSVKAGEYESNEVNFGPVMVRKIVRRVEYVKAEGRVMGVLYITGVNMGKDGDVKVGGIWAKTHYRSEFFIIATLEKEDVYKNPVIVTKK